MYLDKIMHLFYLDDRYRSALEIRRTNNGYREHELTDKHHRYDKSLSSIYSSSNNYHRKSLRKRWKHKFFPGMKRSRCDCECQNSYEDNDSRACNH